MKPTTGRLDIHGWAGSLLEVDTGFHPELTGRARSPLLSPPGSIRIRR
jgi:ABC-type polysaccharide/polyol phosphate transport system ATPase subunit